MCAGDRQDMKENVLLCWQVNVSREVGSCSLAYLPMGGRRGILMARSKGDCDIQSLGSSLGHPTTCSQ